MFLLLHIGPSFHRMQLLNIFLAILVWTNIFVGADIWSSIWLPEEHIPYLLNNNEKLKTLCEQDENCPYKDYLNSVECWGYENNCDESNRMSNPACPQDCSKGWAKTKADQVQTFWLQSDFGYVKSKMEEKMTMCESQEPGDSSLKCIKNTRYCEATNLYMDFRNLNTKSSKNRYREDVFKQGEIGGHCKFNSELLKAENKNKSPLQSWYAELQEYSSLDFKPIEDKKCDVTFEKPAILMKLDAGVNMFHHFCDYINLYASLHMNNSFSSDVFIIMWDTSAYAYGDFFSDTWKAFSNHKVIPLSKLDGKRVCFKDALFPLLPRMIRGLYYNMPLIPGCHTSSLFRAFSQHVLHRLDITQEGPLENKFRITLLSRSSKYRKIMNQDELVTALQKVAEYEVKVVDYNGKFPFLEQLQVTHNSDMFIGMHGAGLTHMLFQPDWGTIFEIYNCEDEGCYSDLARQRGLNYLTWERKDHLIQEDEGHHPTLGAHAKFTNYGFGVDEFLRMVAKGVDNIKNHPAFIKAHKKKYPSKRIEL